MFEYSETFDESLVGEKSDSLHAKLIEPRFAVKDFDVQPQYINHWRKQELFFDYRSSMGKRPFSFVDFIWIRMIEKLKDVGIRFEIIRKVKDVMQSKPLWAKEDLNYLLDLLIQKKPEVHGTKEGRKRLEEKRIILNDQSKIQTYFSNLVTLAVAKKRSLYFLINPQGEVMHSGKSNLSDKHKDKKFISSFKSFYISISVTEIIQEFIEGKKRSIANHDLDIISEEEYLVLSELEEGVLVKLIVKTESSEYDLFDGRSIDEVKDRYLEVITSKPYEEITFLNNRGTETKFLNPNQIELVESG